jgi:hypothetical protein
MNEHRINLKNNGSYFPQHTKFGPNPSSGFGDDPETPKYNH